MSDGMVHLSRGSACIEKGRDLKKPAHLRSNQSFCGHADSCAKKHVDYEPRQVTVP